MNPFAELFIHVTIKAGQTAYRFLHQTTGVNGDLPEMYLMIRRTQPSFTAVPTSFNDAAQPTPITFTNAEFLVDEMRHNVTCKVDSSCVANDDLGNEYMKVVAI